MLYSFISICIRISPGANIAAAPINTSGHDIKLSVNRDYNLLPKFRGTLHCAVYTLENPQDCKLSKFCKTRKFPELENPQDCTGYTLKISQDCTFSINCKDCTYTTLSK